ncbi:hypothetical protein BJV82DRAFT_511269 [Fennellomyces sp. T-0311]|nr:hypothetical protein BJV82DRAFT_511269 [Fennellomyces sp. T-0311]
MELVGDLYLAAYNVNKKDGQTEGLIEKAKALKTLALSKTSRPPLDMVPYQRLVWVLDSESSSKLSLVLPGMVQDAAHVWHRRLWRSSVFQQNLYQLEPSMHEVSINITDGPQNLYQSVETTICLNLLSFVDKMSADAYENAVKQLKSLRQFLATNVNLKDRKAIEIIMLISSAYQILKASEPVLHPIFYNETHNLFLRLNSFIDQLAHADLYTKSSSINYDEAFETFSSIISALRSGALNKYYIVAFMSLIDAIRHYRSKDVTSFFGSIGRARACMGLAFVTAYVPDYPVDPTAEPRLRVDLLHHRKEQGENNVDVRQHIEKIITGNSTNAAIQEQQKQINHLDAELSACSTTFSLRPAKSQLDDIFVDLASLQKHLLASNTEALIEALMDDNNANPMTIQRERLLQGNVIQFIDRIHVKYPMYRDILQPLLVAVDDVKYGLRLMASTHQRDRADAYLRDVVSLFIRDPSVATIEFDWHMLTESTHLQKLKAIVFERAPMSRKWAFYLSILVAVLERLVMTIETHGYLAETDLSSVNSIFAEIVQVWKAAQEYKRVKEAEKEQMYKTRAKKYEPATEEEQEEADKKKLFADFNESFADLQENEDTPMNTTEMKVEEESVLDDSDIQRIGELHRNIFDFFSVDACQPRTSNGHDRELLRSYTIAAQLASMATTSFDNTVDIHCGAGHLRATTLSLRRLEATNSFSKTSDGVYDFYTSENVAEAKQVQPIVQRFKDRVQHIQQEWPDHAVLQHLVVICDRLLGFSIVSPVAKFLTGIELLLQKSEDWEAYAAKHVSLKAQREELIQLIVHWRQLELNCWPTLLAAQEQYSQNAAYTWWFHLFDTVNGTAFTDVTKQSELIGALDQFFQTCSLIEFEPRLKMLDSFARQATVQAELSEAEDQQAAATLLRNVCAYYSQFKSHVQLMLGQMRKPIEKELKESVKIATWKDVNIHALRQSAHKTHKQLHKCIRKYREALGTSMLTVIANYNQEHAMFQYGDEKRYNDLNQNFVDQLSQPDLWLRDTIVPATTLSANDQVKRHLQDLPGTLTKMRRYCREDVLTAPHDIPLEGFMTQVIEQIKDFQKETPAMMTDENKSMVKNQKLLKKKALVDFLKELRRLGLKSRPGTLATQNSDTTYLFSQHVAALDTVLQDHHLQRRKLSSFSGASDGMVQVWERANEYYYRSIARVSHLRKLCTTEVSRDLSRLEVERSMSATEHMFSLVTKERTLATRFEERMQVLQSAAIQLAALYDTQSTSHVKQSLDQRLVLHKRWVDDLVEMVSSAVATLSIQAEYLGQKATGEMQQLYGQMLKMQQAIDKCFAQRYLSAIRLKSTALLTADVDKMITTNESTMKTIVYPALEEVMSRVPQMTHVVQTILQAIDRCPSVSAHGAAPTTDFTTLRDQLHGVIDAILVSVQDVKKVKAENRAAAQKETDEEDQELSNMAENYIRDHHSEQFTLVQALHMDTVAKRCVSALASAHELLCTDHATDTLNLLQQAYPFLQQYMLMVQHTLSQFLTHHKSMAKMTYALINSFTIIISKGFCMPAGAEEEGEEGEADGTTMGTGIGEGEGNKDVSEEIEDEEQVLGTQNEEQRKQEKSETKEEKNGMEMENDFDGELEDVDPDEDDDQQKDDDDDDSEEELDDEIGDVDDMDAVDDKMWGDDEEHDERKDTDKTVDQQQGQQQQQESDIVAKEEDEQQPQSKGEKPEQQEDSSAPDQKQDDHGGDEEEGDEGEGSGDEREDETGQDDEAQDENRAGEQMNVEVPEAETLELPEDLNMDAGDEEQEGGQNEEEFLDPMDMDEEQKEGGDEEMGDEEGEQFQDPLDHVGEGEQDKTQDQEDEEMADAAAHMPDQEDEEGGENEEGKEEEQEDAAGDVDQKKGGQLDENEQEEEEKGKSHNREHPNDEIDAADNQFGVQGQTGKMSSTSKGKQQGEDEKVEEDAQNEEEQPSESQDQQGTAERGTNQANDDSDKPEEEQPAEAKTNPQRSLGDALESWRRRLADVADAEDEDDEEETKQDDDRDFQVNDDHAFEYIKNDDEAHDLQTMGNAAADQLQDINMGAMDETTHDESAHAGEMDIDDQEEQEAVDTMPLPREAMDEVQGDHRGAILSKRLPESQLPEEGEVLTMDESLIAHEPLDPEAIERMRQELETTISEWREEGRDSHQARDLWQRYENLTHDLAMGLCEQLRLILEPTLATKLKGDYRTGKRLNMKKIIPYIASQFKKDKIWLRRTKPSKRQYQVMISVDDSKSMSESHSVQLAYETLSLISKALSQLEVGDIAITSFGERIRLLHPFDQPFTAESGASVLQQFTFAQQKTHVKQLIESSLSLFENAQSNSNGELWQLQLIISDGICDDHETLKRLVRQAMDQHVMLIFIVVDNKPEKDSILKMTNVKYTTVNGKLTLQMKPYLETFPFQYFMVLRDINALPEALSDALRQYFSFVSA